MNSLRYLKFEIKAPIPSKRNPEGNMLRCAAAAAALSFLSTSDRKRSYSLYRYFAGSQFSRVSSMFLLVTTT